MKKITQILMLFLCFINIVKAQDFAPGQQAQGLLESKNVTVDYSTGIFHYKVPLYTLKSGDFELPITLDYTGKGVKMDDRPGLLGYNWTLNTGGVVTRTVRGGIPDESVPYGFLWTENSTTPLKDDLTQVNQHKRDGECDIFTAVFGGQSVNFILRKSGNNIYAEPLERTNVRIECMQTVWGMNNDIDGWIIIDENGNRYTFRQKEYMKDVLREEAISFNGIHGMAYVSSWYLNKIEPLNSQAIVFDYLEDVNPDSTSLNVQKIGYGMSEEVTYKYGRPWVERNFDFEPYKTDFITAISQAEAALQLFGFGQQAVIKMNEFTRQGHWVSNPSFGRDIAALQTHYRILGYLADFKKVTEASIEVITELDRLIGVYGNSTDSNVQMAVLSLKGARNLVIECLQKKTSISEKKVENSNYYTVYSPLLHIISCKNEVLEFAYQMEGAYSFNLASVTSKQYNGKVKSSHTVEFGASRSINGISCKDASNALVSNMKFEYYPVPTAGNDSIPDRFGGYLKACLLKTIKGTEGGEIHIDYEQNRVKPFEVETSAFFPEKQSLFYAGMRLHSLVIKEPRQVCADTIEYAYPLSACSFLYYENFEKIDYGTFYDLLFYTYAPKRRFEYMTEGNNGIFYPYVQERIKGKGCNTYYFTAPTRRSHYPHYYWLYGLPLASAVYDEQGHLKQVVLNSYYASPVDGDMLEVWKIHFDGVPEAGYAKSIPQVQADKFYMNAAHLSAYYKKQGSTRLYDGVYFEPFQESYLVNIAPRTNYSNKSFAYSLRYGGKVLLKEQKVYHFTTQATDSIGYDDIFKLTENVQPYQQTRYDYDNLESSVLPTRIVKIDSQGAVCQTQIKRVTEMEPKSDAVIDTMFARNLLSPVMKQTEWKGDTLLEEKVNRYKLLESEDSCYVCLAEQSSYVPTSLVTGVSTALDSGWYRYGKNEYQTMKLYDYVVTGLKSCLSGNVNSRSENTTYLYSHINENLILQAENVSHKHIAAFEQRDSERVNDNVIQRFKLIMHLSKQFHDAYAQIDRASLEIVADYLQSERHQKVLRLIDMIATDSYPENPTVLKNMLDSIVNGNVMGEFNYMYTQVIIPRCPPLILVRAYEWIGTLCANLSLPAEDEYSIYRYAYSIYNRCIVNAEAEVTIVPKSAHMKLYTIFYDYYNTFSYQIKYQNGTTVNKTVKANNSVAYKQPAYPYTFDIVELELDDFENIDAIIVSPKQSFCTFWVIAPDDAIFEATSYNTDGTVFARFNQNGALEMNEYDAFGRVIRVVDRKGKTIKEFQYNTVLNQ